MNTTPATIIAVQIIERTTGRVTRQENARGLTPTQADRLVRNLESAARGDEAGRYEVRTINATTADTDPCGPHCGCPPRRPLY